MIYYDKLFSLMEKKHITKYALVTKYGFCNSTIERLRNNQSVTIDTIDRLCSILECQPSDIIEYRK